MNDDSLASLVGSKLKRKFTGDSNNDDAEEYQAFSFGRVGNHAQQRIEFQKADGYRIVLPYVDLKSIETNDPSKAFTLEFIGRKIAIEGRNLNKCYEFLRNDRVMTIEEAPREIGMSLPESESLISRLTIK